MILKRIGDEKRLIFPLYPSDSPRRPVEFS